MLKSFADVSFTVINTIALFCDSFQSSTLADIHRNAHRRLRRSLRRLDTNHEPAKSPTAVLGWGTQPGLPNDSPVVVYLRDMQLPADLISARDSPTNQSSASRRSTSANRLGTQRKLRKWSLKSKEVVKQNLSRM